MRRTSLHRRLLFGVLGTLALLSVALVIQGQYVNEEAERVVLRSLLDVEMDAAIERLKTSGSATPPQSRNMRLYDGAAAPLPRGLQGLAPGLHDDLEFDGRDHVILVRDALGRRLALALDITDFEREELRLARNVAISSLALAALFSLALAWSLRRMLRPLDALAADIETLDPDRSDQRLRADGRATRELQVIADAFNQYLDRQARFVEREREFVHTASHELRTPVAVIAQAAELALGSPDLGPRDRRHVDRIAAATAHIVDLLTLLLVLARDPRRVAEMTSDCDLAQLLASIVDDHRHLLAGRELTLDTRLPASLPCALPEAVVRAVVGNLLRNAIEHSGRGAIVVGIDDARTIVIDDPGQHMAAAEISALYARAVRDPQMAGRAGIGLQLIARLCEHMDWTLGFAERPGGGTRTRLTFAPPAQRDGPSLEGRPEAH